MKAKFSIFLVLLIIMLAGCADKSQGDETTIPLDKIINGLKKSDASEYKSAFPPDYIERAAELFVLVGENIDTKLKETFAGAIQAHEVNYGKNFRITYKLLSKKPLTKEQLSEEYLDYYVLEYELPIDSIEEAYLGRFDIKVKGDEAEETKQAEYKLIKIDGIWYLHPESFMNMFSI